MKLLFFSCKWSTMCHIIRDNLYTACEIIDCDEHNDEAIKYNVTTVPVFIAVDTEGKEIARCDISNPDMLNLWFLNLQLSHNKS